MKNILIVFLALVLLPALALTQSPQTVTVTIVNGAHIQSNAPGFSPQNVTVAIGVNNTVVWVNSDTTVHTVTSNSKLFDSLLKPGNSTQYTFTSPGVYPYHCTIHSWMVGYVIVKQVTQTNNSTYLVAGVVIAAIIVIAVSFFSLRRRKKTG